MPEFWAHSICANVTLQQLEQSPAAEMINRNTDSFILGSQGSDLLYFRPLHLLRGRKGIVYLATRLHRQPLENIAVNALKMLGGIARGAQYERAFAYVCGFITHHAVDQKVHPLIERHTERMIRHRRELIFSWPHLLWMLAAMLNLADNWMSSWDFRGQKSIALSPLGAMFLFVVIVYFECALVSPDFEGGETYDMKTFHEREGPTYIAAALVMGVSAFALNLIAGHAMGVENWVSENWLVGVMLAPPIAALLVKKSWMQVLAPLVFLCANIAYAMIYYPVLA